MRDEAHITLSGERWRMSQHASVISGTGRRVHFGKQHQGHRIARVQRDALGGEQAGEAGAQGGLRLVSERGAAGDRHVQPGAGQPAQALHGAGEAADAAFGVVVLGAVVVQADAHGQSTGVARVQPRERLPPQHHRAHGVGQHQGAQAQRHGVFQHSGKLGIHERLAAREPHLLEWVGCRLLQEAAHFGGGYV